MSKVKQETRGHYELLYIIPNKFTEEEAGQIHEKIKENLSQKKAEITNEEIWGKKKLAYRIKEFYHGYYNLIEFNSDKEHLAVINNFLKLLDEILRYQIVKKKELDEKEMERIKKIQERNKKEEEKIEEMDRKKKEGEDEEEEEVKEEKRENKKKKEGGEEDKVKKDIKEKKKVGDDKKEEKNKEEEKEEKEKVDLEELDKKLDNILNTDDLI